MPRREVDNLLPKLLPYWGPVLAYADMRLQVGTRPNAWIGPKKWAATTPLGLASCEKPLRLVITLTPGWVEDVFEAGIATIPIPSPGERTRNKVCFVLQAVWNRTPLLGVDRSGICVACLFEETRYGEGGFRINQYEWGVASHGGVLALGDNEMCATLECLNRWEVALGLRNGDDRPF